MKPATPIGILSSLLALALTLTTTACGGQPGLTGEQASVAAPAAALISGTVSYRERMALTNQAVVEITLEDASRQDVAARVIARRTISDPGQVPIRFELEFSPADIDPRLGYTLRARIRDHGRLVFTSDTGTPVLTRGAGREAHLLLVSVQKPPAAADSVTGESGMLLEGMFRYFADAALFRDCNTGRSYPVAMEASYPEVEHAYLNSGIEPGSEILVRLRGRYLERPSMEGNINKINLIIDAFEGMDSKKSCAPIEPAELRDTYWKLLELDGRPVVAGEGMREVHVILASDASRAHGHAGCNDFFGSFQTAEDTLSFSALGSTMMACPEGMDTEQAFLEALGETTRYEISGQVLSLFADDRLLARLEAVYF